MRHACDGARHRRLHPTEVVLVSEICKFDTDGDGNCHYHPKGCAAAYEEADKRNRKRWDAYQICKERGHTASNITLTSIPPQSVCEFCGTTYYYERKLVEVLPPTNPEED